MESWSLTGSNSSKWQYQRLSHVDMVLTNEILTDSLRYLARSHLSERYHRLSYAETALTYTHEMPSPTNVQEGFSVSHWTKLQQVVVLAALACQYHARTSETLRKTKRIAFGISREWTVVSGSISGFGTP